MAGLQPESVVEMLARLSEIDPQTGCHLWMGKIGTGGYAYCAYRIDGKRFHRKAATVAFELAKGLVPPGLEISHTCDNPRCVNPEHLLAETHAENLARRPPFDRRTYKGFCKRGHPIDGVKRAANGGCPICEADRVAAWKAARPGYDNEYREANKERINARRRQLRRERKV